MAIGEYREPEETPKEKLKTQINLHKTYLRQRIAYFERQDGSESDVEKHQHKLAVLEAASEVLKTTSGNTDDLEDAMSKHHRYNEALFSSATQELVNQTKEMARSEREADDTPRHGRR